MGRPRKHSINMGERFGSRTIIGEADFLGSGIHRMAIVRCDCGHESTVSHQSLRIATATQCRACASRANVGHLLGAHFQPVPITIGERFGQRVILAEAAHRKKARMVEVRCDCGRHDIVNLCSLRKRAADQCRGCGGRGNENGQRGRLTAVQRLERQSAMVAMKAQGLTTQEIAQRYGLCRTSVYNIIRGLQ